MALTENKGHLLIFTVEKIYIQNKKKIRTEKQTNQPTTTGGDVGANCFDHKETDRQTEEEEEEEE